MHIVHVGVGYRTETTDGATRAASTYAEYQRRLGHDVTMVRFSSVEPYQSLTHGETGIREVCLPVPRLSLTLGPRAAKFFRANEPAGSVFHFHTSYARHYLAARLLPVPYLVSPHGAYLPDALQRARLWNLAFRLLIGRAYLGRAAAVHAITPSERDAVLGYAHPRRVAVIANPLHPAPPLTEAERDAARAHLGLTGGDVCVLFIGRLDVECKGLDVLVEGFRLARMRGGASGLKLVFAGPPVGRSLAGLVPADMGDAFSLFPPVFSEEKRALFAAADVVACPSRWDVMPTALLEALSLGLPLLVSEATGFADFVHQNQAGRVVTQDADDIAEAIRRLAPGWSSSRRTAIAEAALSEFHPARTAARLVELYEEATALPFDQARTRPSRHD